MNIKASDVYKIRDIAEHISSTLKMEAISSSETSVETQRTTRRRIPEDDTLQNHRCENLKSYRDKAFGKYMYPTLECTSLFFTTEFELIFVFNNYRTYTEDI
jgi:hypothetical protein